MTVIEKIIKELGSIPAAKQIEVLDFVEYIKLKADHQDEVTDWDRFSLNAAMEGMEAEPELYTLEDLRERI
ncbi:MAG: hypothetical protein NTW14_07295 [bacterium]|nr:hypothetical protein [bacterium]